MAETADTQTAEPIGIYIHIPFCARKCPYCDFNTYAGLEGLQTPYVEALLREIDRQAEAQVPGMRVASIFIGGGTPTVLEAPAIGRILDTVRARFQVRPDAEISCEANPGTVDRERFGALVSLGVNRLSLGVQSLQESELTFLGRIHDVGDAYRAVENGRRAGFQNINLDLMFGLPDQDRSAWSDTLDRVLSLGPEHLSLYSLIVEPHTPLHAWVESGQIPAPDDDQAASHYELAMERLDSAGYVHYEVSNWALPGGEKRTDDDAPAKASRHNLGYWRNGEWLGFGAGAHSHQRLSGNSAVAHSHRWSNVRPVQAYIRRILDGRRPEVEREVVPPSTAMGESMMLGLRLVREGLRFERFLRHHQQDAREVYAEALTELAGWDLVEMDAVRLRLTRRGLLLGNQVFQRFL